MKKILSVGISDRGLNYEDVGKNGDENGVITKILRRKLKNQVFQPPTCCERLRCNIVDFLILFLFIFIMFIVIQILVFNKISRIHYILSFIFMCNINIK